MARSREADKRNETDDQEFQRQGDAQDSQGQDSTSDSGNNSSNWRQLEEAKKQAEEQAKSYKELAFASIAQLAGYDTSKGITKRLIAEYEGDPTPSAFLEFAKSEGLEPHMNPSSGGSDSGGSRAPSELEQGMETLQNRSDNLRNTSSEGTSSTFHDELSKAQSEGRWADVVALGVKQTIAQSR